MVDTIRRYLNKTEEFHIVWMARDPSISLRVHSLFLIILFAEIKSFQSQS